MIARADVEISESVFQGERCWIVKDPVALKYFQLKPPEYRVFRALDGSATYTQLRRTLADEFPDLRPGKEEIQNLIISLHRNGLLLVDAADQAAPLRRQRSQESRQKMLGMLSSIISIRFPGVNPDRFLNWLYPKVRYVFTIWFAWFAAALFLAALALVLSNFSEFHARLPEFSQFFGVNNLVYMAFVLIFTKSVHELGHGLMCKHFGGECNEIGFMLLAFTPAMYCNTSDSWTLANKWHRMAIGAAGMYVELLMAAMCTFIWWYTHPNWLHYLALNIMFVSSVSTILFNANPLLRYDGYYIFSDFLEIPNLSQKANLSLINRLRVWCLGMKPASTRLLPERNQVVFAIFSIASFAYRWFVLVMIFWFISSVLEPYGLEIIAHVVVFVAIFGMVIVPLIKLARFFLYPGRMREVKRKRLIITLALLSGIAAFVCLVPFEHGVWGSFVLLPLDAQHVYVQQPGRIVEIRAMPGDYVRKGDVIAVLDNSEVITAIDQLQAELVRLESQLESFRLSRDTIPNADNMIGQLASEIEGTKRQVAIREEQKQLLVLKADRDGVIIPPPNIVMQPASSNQLGTFYGSPFDRENRDAYLAPQTLFCYVGDPAQLKAVAAVEERDAKLIQPDQTATLLLNQFRDERFEGTVSRVSSKELETLPREISKTNGGFIGGEPALDTTDGTAEKPLLRMYEATIEFSGALPAGSKPGFFGQTKITVGNTSLGARAYRYVMSLINFR